MKKTRPHSCTRRTVTVALLFGALASLLPAAIDKPSSNGGAKTAPKDIADMDLTELVNVRVSPFDVSLRLDKGYRASNSVSGSRFDAPIRDLPFAIQAFTESFVADQKPVTIIDVVRYSPGVTYRSNDFNEGNANVAIRGFAVGSLAGGNIHVLRDGFHGPSIFDFTNISRVEVVKGPASFLYGQIAPGGIVNVITKNPQPEFAATAKASYGSYNGYRVEADVTGPASQTLFYRVAASYDQDMHYWEPYDAHSRDLAPSLLWQPNERVSVSLKYENFRKDETPQLMQKPGYNRQAGVIPTASDPNLSGVDVPGLPDNWNSMSFADYRRSETDGLSAWVDLKADDHWNLRAGYSHQTAKIDALFSGNLGMSNNQTFLQGRRLRFQIYDNRDDTYQADAVGKYQFANASLRLLLGAQHVDRQLDRRAGQAPNDPVLGTDPIGSPLPLWDLRNPATWNRVVTIPLSPLTAGASDFSTQYVDRSVYAGSTLGFLGDRLLVLTGWRWTSTKSQNADNLARKTDAPSIATMITPQYGVLYKITPELSLFGSYAESFVPGTFLINNLDGTTKVATPTEGTGFDVGLKGEFLGGRVSGTLTFFDVENKNIVNDLSVTSASSVVTIYNVQSGKQRSRGVELDVSATLTERWQLYVSYSYMNARITEFSGHDAEILAQDPATLDAAGRANFKNVHLFHNARLQMSAPHLANLWTRYDFARGGAPGAYLGGGVNLVYDQTLLPDSPPSSRQTYALVNALVGYAWDSGRHHLSIDVTGKNLADEHYRPSQSSRSRPREFLVTFTAKF